MRYYPERQLQYITMSETHKPIGTGIRNAGAASPSCNWEYKTPMEETFPPRFAL